MLDSVLGGLSAEEERRLRERSAAEPGLAAERERWSRVVALARQAHEVRLDPRAAERVAARVVDRVRREEDRAPAPARTPRGVIWARLLALSVGVHVLVLGVLSYRTHQDRAAHEPIESFPSIAGAGVPEPTTVASDRDEGMALAAPAPYVLDQDRLPVERLFAPEPSLPPFVPAPDRTAYAPFGARTGRSLWVRSNDPLKRLIEARVGVPGSLDLVKKSLGALAVRARPDGSYDPAPGSTRAETTALVLLAFLGDGQSSRSGEHQAAVEKGIAWLRAARGAAADAPVGPYEVWALSEDFMFANGTLTPAESRERSGEIARLAESLRARPGARRATAGEDWTDLALAAAARAAGVAAPSSLPPIAGASVVSAVVDPRTAMLDGTDALRAGREAFRAWAANAGPALAKRLEPDGLAGDPARAPAAQRVEETALVLLALQVPYRSM